MLKGLSEFASLFLSHQNFIYILSYFAAHLCEPLHLQMANAAFFHSVPISTILLNYDNCGLVTAQGTLIITFICESAAELMAQLYAYEELKFTVRC